MPDWVMPKDTRRVRSGVRALLALVLVASACNRGDRTAGTPRVAAIEAKARGNEPFWAVDVTPTAIVYRTPELLPDSLAFPLVPAVSDSGSHAWTTTASGRTLTLRVTRGPCQDTMSGQDFAWSAVIEMDSTSATGCANVTE